MFNYKKTLLAGYGLLAGLVLLAAMPVAQANEASAEEIARINEDVAVLSAKLAAAEMQAKLDTKRQEIKKINEPLPTSPEALPVVKSIEGADGRLIATLITSTGALQSVIKGDKIGKWTVSKIKINAVTLRRGKHYEHLAFGNVAPVLPTYPSLPSIPFSAPILIPPAQSMR